MKLYLRLNSAITYLSGGLTMRYPNTLPSSDKLWPTKSWELSPHFDLLSRSLGQIPLGPVPRNFLVANVTRKSPTSYGLVTRKSGVSPVCYGEVGDVANKSARKLRGTGPSGIWPIASVHN